MKNLLTLALFISNVSTNERTLLNELSNIQRYFKKHVLVYYKKHAEDKLLDITTLITIPSHFTKTLSPSRHRVEKYEHILVITDEQNLNEDVSSLVNTPVQNSAKIVVIIGVLNLEIVKKLCKYILSSVWDGLSVARIIVLFITTTDWKYCSWNLYRNDNCRSVEHVEIFEYWTDKYFVAQFNNMYKCPLMFTGRDRRPFVKENKTGGVDVNILDATSKLLNATLTFKPSAEDGSYYAFQFPDGRYGPAYGLAVNRSIDVVTGGLLLTHERLEVVDFAAVHVIDDLSWMAPAFYKSDLRVLLNSFTDTLWYFYILSIVSVSVVTYFVSVHKNIKFTKQLFNLLRLFLGQSVDFHKFRYFFGFMSICFMLLTSAYQNCLLSHLIKFQPRQTYRNERDAVDNGMTVLLFGSLLIYVNQTDHDFWNKVLVPGKYATSFRATEDVAEKGTCITIVPMVTAKCVVEELFIDENGEALIKPMGKFVNTYSVLYFSKNNPLVPKFVIYLSRLKQSGLIDYWLKENQVDRKPKKHSRLSALSLNHFRSLFFVYFAGLVSSFVIFCAEILYNKWFFRVKKTAQVIK